MLRSFKTQGTKTKTILTLATVGIISAFLVGNPQHASADQTYVSDPNQAMTFSELETTTNTNTITQTGVSSETPTTVTTVSHTSVDDIHTHENDYEQTPTNTPTFEELKQDSQTASNTVDSQTGSKTYETRIPTNTDSNHKAVENHSEPKTETVAQAQTCINIQGKPGCVARSIYDGEVSAVFGYGGMWNGKKEPGGLFRECAEPRQRRGDVESAVGSQSESFGLKDQRA